MISSAIENEDKLLSLALSLGARTVEGWSRAELDRVRHLDPLRDGALVQRARNEMRAGGDPLGEMFCSLRSPAVRRFRGATYTPKPIVESMLSWAACGHVPDRVVDPGAGSGRFLVSAGRKFPAAALVGVEVDPVASILLRANLAATGLAARSTVLVDDYRNVSLPKIPGRSLFTGNPPYVRHHLIEKKWKNWLAETAKARNLRASQLAGLHVHFILKTVEEASVGDYGSFITSAEWLDVNYGSLVRELVLEGLGGQAVHLIEPKLAPFPDAATTGAITCFEVGKRPAAVSFSVARKIGDLKDLRGGQPISRDLLLTERRWTVFTRKRQPLPEGCVELGEFCRVHRGQVTGGNRIWIAGPHATGLPRRALFPAVTKARELIEAGTILFDGSGLRKVIDLPPELDLFHGAERRAIERFLRWARRQDAHRGYIARTRRAWWSVGLREPAPILATYMARRPPVFVRNLARARNINIAHGIYPQIPLNEKMLNQLVEHLSANATVSRGRTYAGGLTKFEPREMERVPVPSPELLAV
ncbi:MAG: Eco57I restriction-modification methylase domain-containing protein [Alphaproteobacteria bacterium]